MTRTAADRDPIATLTWHYEHPRAAAREAHRRGRPVIGVTSNTVPWELVRAAGAVPVLVTAAHETTPLADPFMEPVFDRRIRSIFEDLLRGRWSFLRALITPRTSEWEHKLYLYLVEVRRQTAPARRRRLPTPWLYDLLQTRSPEAARYGLDRTHALIAQLEQVTRRRVGGKQIAAAVRESNRWREAIRALLRLRRGRAPRISGAEALPLIGAGYFMPRDEHARHLTRAVTALTARPPLRGPRVMVKGSPLDHPGLHRSIERHGAIVVAEDDWWGSRSAGRDAGAGSVAAVFRKYYLDAPGPRVFPSERADAWFAREVGRGIDGVVYYLPPDDDVLGWDYPRHRRVLEAHGIPVTLVREDARHLTPETEARLVRFVASLQEPRG